jgi:hypothetical protein
MLWKWYVCKYIKKVLCESYLNNDTFFIRREFIHFFNDAVEVIGRLLRHDIEAVLFEFKNLAVACYRHDSVWQSAIIVQAWRRHSAGIVHV